MYHQRRFDHKTYSQLCGIDARLLEAIDFDTRCQAKKSPSGARYSLKSQAWWALKIGVCRETISDHMRKLEKLGILEITRRNPRHGLWQTNMVKIRSWIWWRLGKVLRNLRKVSPRVTQVSHKSNLKKGEENQEGPQSDFGRSLTAQILDRWRTRAPL